MDEGKNGGVVDGKTDEQTDKQTDWKNGELYRKLSTVTTSLSGTKKTPYIWLLLIRIRLL